jgi:hypothetical protein
MARLYIVPTTQGEENSKARRTKELSYDVVGQPRKLGMKSFPRVKFNFAQHQPRDTGIDFLRVDEATFEGDGVRALMAQ